MLTAAAHKCKHVRQFPPPAFPKTNGTLYQSIEGDLDWAAVASCPQRILPLPGEGTGRPSPAIAGITGETPNFA